ncbi:centrosomal protein POC5 isoform X2 [Protopterus annectens]|uniref:centrosomal protein POC5 isoform X2 n=1 Tax=Protopterus annectens TaxID=7888 RepID=UPI001CFADC35|nr:centrosomal protein POC5 isoform X2 [Protopterus annectens]
MSSDEEGTTGSPVLPKDSDPGSSVSSDLQDEYEELLRFAVVTPKFEPGAFRQSHHFSHVVPDGNSSGLIDDAFSQPTTGADLEQKEADYSSLLRHLRASEVLTAPASTSVSAPPNPLEVLEAEGGFHHSIMSSLSSHHTSVQLERNDNVASNPEIHETIVTELPVPAENMQRVENILDMWSGNLKANVITELNKWRLTVIEQHQKEMRKMREQHAEHVGHLVNQMENLKELLHTYETSAQRKDEVISTLTHGIQKQKEKVELMRTFTHWRMQHFNARQEAYANGLADKHYKLYIMRKVWAAWHSLIEVSWKEKVAKACQARAEEVCVQLSNDYEGKIAELNDALEAARIEIQRLHSERERFEESMKKAFMRGVCALNMEAMTMFQGREARKDPEYDYRREESGPISSVHFPSQPPGSSARFSPVHFETSVPPSTGTTDTDQPITRVVTSAQQKAGKTITARIMGRSDIGPKGSRIGSDTNVMGVSPPMSSVVVERHHPVTRQTIGHATAARYPHSAQPSSSIVGGRITGQSGKTQHGPTSIQSIKVVD